MTGKGDGDSVLAAPSGLTGASPAPGPPSAPTPCAALTAALSKGLSHPPAPIKCAKSQNLVFFLVTPHGARVLDLLIY